MEAIVYAERIVRLFLSVLYHIGFERLALGRDVIKVVRVTIEHFAVERLGFPGIAAPGQLMRETTQTRPSLLERTARSLEVG